jgi:hypothetical protein
MRLRDTAGKVGQKQATYVAEHAAAAIDYLERQAPGTVWVEQARELFTERKNGQMSLLRLAELLDQWLNYVEAGMADLTTAEVGARVAAATDLMEQVQRLLDDTTVHAAAPIVLAGAALEEYLRSMVIRHSVTVTGKPSIGAYAQALRVGGHLTPQDVKDVTAWAGIRNDAAHGQFDALSAERAQLMVDGINLFLRQNSVTTP